MSYPFEPSPAGQPPVAPPPPPWHTPGRTQEPSPAPALMSPPPQAGPPLAGPPMAAPPPPMAAPPPPQRPRTSRAALVATATGAALLASTLTAGVTWSLADNGALTRPSAAATATPEAGPAVVPASSTTTQPDWQAVADAARPSVVAIAVQTAAGSGEGSGVIIDAAGHVLTNDHVAGSAQQLKVTLADGRVFDATLVGADPTTDLAVIALTNAPNDLVPAKLGDSDAAAVGQAVMAVGNPLGLDSTVTTGIISALDRPVSTGSLTGAEPVVTNAIQVDAAINPGNSGGPLFDATGRVIGITSSIASLSQGGGSAGSIGLGFAIPANLAKRIADELITDGVAQHAFLGVSLSDGTATLGDTTRLGAVVQEVSNGSPAADAGLQSGDVVVAIDNEAVSGALSLTASVRELATGDDVSLTVVRDGKSLEISVTLAARQESAQAQPIQPRQGR